MSKSSSVETIEMSISARRTESLDAPDILQLVTNDTYKLFGRVNVAHMIEKSNLAVTLVDDNNLVVGHAAFYDHPNCNIGSGEKWTSWMKQNFVSEYNDPINTLFLHYYVSKELFSEGILNEILRTVFHAVPLLHFIVLFVPSEAELGSTLSKAFDPIPKSDNYDSEYVGYVCHRHNHCPVLHIREARIEDHDDLMPIFNQHTKSLTEIYGDFFLAELIEAQNDENKCLVADVDGTAVGFMSISTEINTDVLKENFELDVFNHLMKKMERKIPVQKQIVETKTSDLPEEIVAPTIEATPETTAESVSTPSPVKLTSPIKSRMQLSKSRTGRSTAQSATDKSEESAIPVTKKQEKKKEPEVEYKIEEFDVESVFCIQLFIIDDRYEARSIDFLPAIFDLFKDKDFAIITVPHNVPVFPLLHDFQRISPKYTSTLPQELYLFHRHGLLKCFEVVPCTNRHIHGITQLVEDIKGNDTIMKDVNQYINYRKDQDGTQLYVYVAEVLGQAVGVCVLRDEKDIDYIRSHYNIEDFVYFQLHETKEHAHLFHFVLNPIFQHYSKYFLKEILYLAKKSCLYYSIYPDNVTQSGKNNSLITCLDNLVAISSRRQIVYPLDDLGENKPIDEVISEKEPYALYHLNRKLTLEPKVVINIRIVVVGASDVGIAALETLAYCPHICFNNLTLVSDVDIFNSPTGFDDVRNSFLPQSLNYSNKQHALMSLSTWVNFVNGKMTKIDRKKRCLIINGSQKIPFDQLLLCTGQQYHTTAPTGADVNALTTTQEALNALGGHANQVHHGFTPDNVFTVNSTADSLQVLNWVKNNSMDTDKVIVYGSTLESYTCINGLLSAGVPGHCIRHVHPPSSPPSCFNDPFVEKTMSRVLDEEGVLSFFGYTLARWNDNERYPELGVATFTSDNKPLTLECQAFFCFQNKSINYNAFKAINDSCLVFDGKLVIDSKFYTNDPEIRAAGSLTKYALRYHTDNWSHANYNSKEIGTKLSESVLELFDPTLSGELAPDEDDTLVPRYKEAKSVMCQLPGGYKYFHMWKPCIVTPLETLRAQPDYGQDLITGDSANGENNYFRLHLNQFNLVQDIVCLSKDEIEVSNLLCLYGMHERFLNNMLQRNDDGLIDDLYSYFRQPWCAGIYHDRFKDFRCEVREILASTAKPELPSLEERVRRIVEEDGVPSKEQREQLRDIFVGDECKTTIEERLNCFLNYNKYHLPMYCRPHML